MITISGYKQLEYPEFQAALNKAFEKSEKPQVQVAVEIKVKSAGSVRSAMKDKDQIVSDQVLTSIMKSVGLAGFVIYIFGEKYYYIKNK